MTTPSNNDAAGMRTAEQMLIDGSPVLRMLSDVQPEPVEWLWPGRFAVGKLTLLAGDPGLGKSFLTLDMAARVSTGKSWPDRSGDGFEPGGVVLLSAEDDPADTIRPRLDAAGADVRRIVVLEAVNSVSSGRALGRTFNLSRDLPALESAIQHVPDCRLVVIDPVTAYLGETDSHKNADVRGLLAPLSALATKHRVAVVAVTHLNKSGNGPAIYRAMGSLAFAAAARAAWGVVKDKADGKRRLLLPIKNNLAVDTGGLAYRIAPNGIGGHPALTWEMGTVTLSADEAMRSDQEEGGNRTERDDAADWLRALLADGPKPAKEIFAEADEAGYSRRTIERAKKALGVGVHKRGMEGGWVWQLPSAEDRLSLEIGGLRTKHDENAEVPPKTANSGCVAAFDGGLRDDDHLGNLPTDGDGDLVKIA